MAEHTTVIATFDTGMEARVAQMLLEAESIPAMVSGDVPSPVSFTLFGRLPFAPIELSVGVSDAARAQDILSRAGNQVDLDTNWEDSAESAVEGWLCLNCDTEVPLASEVCPECGTLRSDESPDDEER